MHSAVSSFYGVATIGAKGQLVIPIEARDHMQIGPGDKVIVIGKRHPTKGFGMLCICPISSAEGFIEEMTNAISQTQAALKAAKESKGTKK